MPASRSRIYSACKLDKRTSSATQAPSSFFAFRGQPEPLDHKHGAQAQQRLEWDVRRSISAILEHPWVPTTGPDAVSIRGFIYDVDTGLLSEVSYPGPTGSIG